MFSFVFSHIVVSLTNVACRVMLGTFGEAWGYRRGAFVDLLAVLTVSWGTAFCLLGLLYSVP